MANTKFSNALKREPQAVPPVWFMRQAGRYHAHYQALRQKHSFIEMCKDPDLAAEVAMGPILDFDFDVSILFSDLLFPLEAMGMGLSYEPAPKLGWHLSSDSISKLRTVGEALPHLEFQKLAAMKTRQRLSKEKSLIGFVGGPWTLFAYAVEGSHKGGLEDAKKNLRLFSKFNETLLPLLKENIRLQFEGGVEIVMLFDTAAGELSPRVYQEAVVPVLRELMHMYPNRLGYYAKQIQAPHLADPIFHSQSQWAGLGYDHRWDLANVLKSSRKGFVQGNFDQSLLFMPTAEFQDQAIRHLEGIKKLSIEERAGWVAGLGHGVLPGTPEAHVRKLIQLTREVLA